TSVNPAHVVNGVAHAWPGRYVDNALAESEYVIGERERERELT
ncbi:unnamed protein product, partial [Rotaria magnacalcarata]